MEGSPVQLIVNADDFGRSRQINAAVIRAHQQGILTSASLMVAGEAAQEAIILARENPRLAVGLHVVVVDGRAVLPQSQLPRLLDRTGNFPNHPIRLGLLYALSREARRQVALEIRAQFERFSATGLPLSHVDGHQHMHMHPAIFDRVLPLARQFGAKGLRIVRDDLRFELQSDRSHAFSKMTLAAVFALLASHCRGTRLASPFRTYGLFRSGRMTVEHTRLILQRMQEPSEIYFHPTQGPRTDQRGPNPQELDVLLNLSLRETIEARQLQLSRYEDLEVA
jgi:hopanoid biosynthesis associated protein HpnK